ncbi:MAG: hypothetical protein KC561_21830, partial [Myxococcales bacterium]|nr:hypothetical protein [Myxococcales bacterium]
EAVSSYFADGRSSKFRFIGLREAKVDDEGDWTLSLKPVGMSLKEAASTLKSIVNPSNLSFEVHILSVLHRECKSRLNTDATAGRSLLRSLSGQTATISASPPLIWIREGSGLPERITAYGQGPLNYDALQLSLGLVGVSCSVGLEDASTVIVFGRSGWSPRDLNHFIQSRRNTPLRVYTQELFFAF